MNPQLSAIGDALERAVAADLKYARRRRGLRISPRAGLAVIAAAIAVPAVAYAASNLFSTSQVAASLPQGTRALIGTHPTCRLVVASVEYRCVLASPPSDSAAPGSAVSGGRATAVVTTASGRKFYVSAKSMPALKRQMASIPGVRRVKLIGAPGRVPGTTNWTGTVEPTVDATKHVDGGCRARNAAGTIWECYIGEAAVKQRIISQGFLGAYAPAPGVG
jgi:hypothetical protein